MFDRLRRLWRIDKSLAKRLSESLRRSFLLEEENRRLTRLIDEYEQGRYERTEAGTTDWKMEVDRFNHHNNELLSLLVYAGQCLAEIEKMLLEDADPKLVARYAHEWLAEIKADSGLLRIKKTPPFRAGSVKGGTPPRGLTHGRRSQQMNHWETLWCQSSVFFVMSSMTASTFFTIVLTDSCI